MDVKEERQDPREVFAFPVERGHTVVTILRYQRRPDSEDLQSLIN
jgi:hypothetical protein